MSRMVQLFLSSFPCLCLCVALHAQSKVQPQGAGKPFSNLQDSIALYNFMPFGGYYPGSIDDYSLGIVRTTAANFAPGNSRTDGRTLDAAASAYFSGVIGTPYGGTSAALKIPNTSGRTIVGAGQGPDLATNWALGQTKGSATVTLTENNLPSHIHSLPAGGNTKPAGAGVPFDSIQPSIAMNYIIRTNGFSPVYNANGSGSGGPGPYIGTVVPWAGPIDKIPIDYMLADGRILNIEQNIPLFTVLGATYGGDAVSNFGLPDLRGRTIIGAGERQGSGYAALVGENLGQESITLTNSIMPTHTHPITPTGTTGPAGSGLPLDNRQPSLAMTYLIAVQGTYPNRDTADNKPYLGEIVAWAGREVPDGYLLADGRSLPFSGNLPLASLLGTAYGGVSGVSFNLPDLRTRTIIGAGPGVTTGQSGLAALRYGTSNFTIDDEGNYVYDLGEIAGSSDYPFEVDNLGEHGFEELIPEPSSLTLLAMAMSVATLARRKRSV